MYLHIPPPLLFPDSRACYSDLKSLAEEGSTILPDRMQRPQSSSSSAVCLALFSHGLGFSFPPVLCCLSLSLTHRPSLFELSLSFSLFLFPPPSGFRFSAHLNRGTRQRETEEGDRKRGARERETTGLLLRS